MLNKRETVLREICRGDGISRREIMRKLNWNIRTVSAYVQLLEKQGLVEGRQVPLAAGRPVMKYFPAREKLAFASVVFDPNGIHGMVADSDGRLLAEHTITEFSLRMEIPQTLFRKLDYFVNGLEKRSGMKINTLSVVFPLGMENHPLATGLKTHLDKNWKRPFYIESPLSAHAHSFKIFYPGYRKILCLHFGFALELVLLDGDEIVPDNEKISASVRNRDFLHHQVSLSTICDNIAALDGNCFYHFEDIVKKMKDEVPAVKKILEEKEAVILSALEHLADSLQPDAIFLLALPSDPHLEYMKKLSASPCVGRRRIPCHFIRREGKKSLPLLKAGAAAAEFLGWRRFFQ